MVKIPDLTATPTLREDLPRDLEDITEDEEGEGKSKTKAGGGGKPKSYKAKPSWTAFRETSEQDAKQ